MFAWDGERVCAVCVGHDGGGVVEGFDFGGHGEVGVDGVGPFDFETGVASHAAHDGGHGAESAALGLVVGEVVADRVEEVVVFLLVGVNGGFFGFVGPRVFAGDCELVTVVDHFDGAEGAMGAFGDVVETAGDLAVLNEHAGTVGVFVFDGEVIVDAAGFFSFPDFGAGDSHGVDGVGVFDPVDDIDVVEAHIDMDVAALPSEVELVVELVLEFVPFGAARQHGACGPHVPKSAGVVDFADGAVVDAFNGFEVA